MTKSDARDACITACQDCSKYSHEPTPADCTYTACPLYPTRQKNDKKEQDWKSCLAAYEAFMVSK